jgi:putative peptidoglycan lipid II flippase
MTIDKVRLSSSVRSSLLVAFISGLAGLTMLLQDVVLASHFAAGEAADAYQFAVSFPSLAINIFAGGTLLAVLVPSLTQLYIANKHAEATALVHHANRLLAAFLFAVCLFFAVLYSCYADIFVTGFSADALILSKRILWISISVLYFSGLAGINAAVLNSRRNFKFISLMPAFMPVAVVVCILLFESNVGIYSAAFGMLLGSLFQWLLSSRLSKSILVDSGFSFKDKTLLSRLSRHYLMSAVSSAFLVGIILTDIFMASRLPSGGVATYNYAVRPVILLLAFVTSVVGNVVLSNFSHLVALNDWGRLKKQTLFLFGFILLGMIPLVAVWYSWTDDFVRILYQRGAFGSKDTANVALVQNVYVLQIPFYLISVIGLRLMNSMNKHVELLLVASICFFVHLGLDFWILPSLDLLGIAWVTNFTFVLQAVLILLYLANVKSNRIDLSFSLNK